ncbi:Small-conductance mechanosensitive channel [Sedimentitalea nanhaiensis]|uniref:Small-conductance mechanosensitive channel n=2 Tax=Sedimentitalea nanhaiensis TaxID=999627 RepID=A0A1I7E0A4_9RHOB|nr:Small-conductance mechanosensitive channel [Sedimentitalea nanhaiensis]
MSPMRSLLRFCCALVLVISARVAMAQLSETQRDFHQNWLATAGSVERLVDNGEASNAVLEKLRSDLVEFREAFTVARDQNSARIKTLESQIDALGPKPDSETGGDEPADIADLRQSLNEQLEKLKVPQVVADEAYKRANGLIGEIDRIVRDRQASQLLSRSPSPLNLVYWPAALDDVHSAISAMINETVTAWKGRAKPEKFDEQWPILLLMVVAGTVLILAGALLSARLGTYLRGFGGKGSGVWGFIVSLVRIFLPFIGIVLLCKAAELTGLLGEHGQYLLQAIPDWSAIYLVFKWLGDQIYGQPDREQLVEFNQNRAPQARLLVQTLAVMLIIYDGIKIFDDVEDVSIASRAVVAFLPILLASIALMRLQQVGMRRGPRTEDDIDDMSRRRERPRVTLAIRRGIATLVTISPIMAMTGYINAAEAIVYPAILTLATIATVLILQRFIGDLYGWLSGKGEAAQDSLFSVIVGLVLMLAALPVLSIFWGARVSDLTELWTKFLVGFSVGGVMISPNVILMFAAIFVIGYTLTRLLQSSLRTNILPKTGIDPGGQNAIVSGVGYIGVFLAALIAVTGTGIDLSSLALVASALSVGIGFGLQAVVSNFVSGIILLVERPISKGDWIDVGGLQGYVRDISVRSTRIETFDRTDVIIPNSDLISGTVTNYTRGNTIGRLIVPVGAAYGTDTRKVEALLREIANKHPMVLANPAPSVVFQGFGADSLDFEIRAILRDVNWVLSVKSDMNHEIARCFAEEGIEIPFAQRDIWLRNPESLPGASTFAPSARHNFTADSVIELDPPKSGNK